MRAKGGDPDVVGRNGGALRSQLPVDGGVVERRFFIGEHDLDAGLDQKLLQHSLVLRTVLTHGKAGSELPHDNQG